jgi:hypothetical protein
LIKLVIVSAHGLFYLYPTKLESQASTRFLVNEIALLQREQSQEVMRHAPGDILDQSGEVVKAQNAFPWRGQFLKHPNMRSSLARLFAWKLSPNVPLEQRLA